jgi:aminoglycoside N3'-acetyltransferase
MMPSFPIKGSMAAYLDDEEIYDVRATPSRTGALCEVFRLRDDVYRSLHPTNPLAAWGSGAEQILSGHEDSLTPYGYETPYGRLVEKDKGYVLMLGTHIHSLLHHLQERVEFPNLFLEKERQVTYIDYEGRHREMRTKVMRPRVPYYIAIPPAVGPDPDWVILHDFALMFPRGREKKVQELGYRFDGYQSLYQRREQLERSGILRTTRLGRTEIGLLQVKDFIGIVEPELRELIHRFRSAYDVDGIIARALPYD